jgi:hypothetical protein
VNRIGFKILLCQTQIFSARHNHFDSPVSEGHAVTRVSIDRLRVVHASAHPAAGLGVAMATELLLTATLSAHGPAAFGEDGSATLHGDGLSGMTMAGPKAGRCQVV